MPQPLAGAGQGLQYPQSLYPAGLLNGVIGGNTNDFSLAPGEALPVPAGSFIITLGKYCSLQYLDPVTQAWTLLRDWNNNNSTLQVRSDGYNVRVVNLTGCVCGATITNGGDGNYVQGTTTVTPSVGTSTWQPIIGGLVNTTVSVTAVGKNYGIAPLVFIAPPPYPGLQATGVAVISSGTISSITVTNQGAGYTAAPAITVLPDPYDPNFLSGTTAITNGTAVCSLTGTGSLTGLLLLNPGIPVATTMTLTIAGAGTTATAVPLFLQTVASASFTNAGAGYGANSILSSSGGFNTNTGAFTNPQHDMTGFIPRPAMATLVQSGGTFTSISKIYDAGLFLSTPFALPLTNGVVTTLSTITFTTGSQNDTVRIQQLA